MSKSTYCKKCEKHRMLATIHRQRIKQLEIAVEALEPARVEKETYEIIAEHAKVVEELQRIIQALTDQLRKEQQANRRKAIPPWEDTNGTEELVSTTEGNNAQEIGSGISTTSLSNISKS